MMIRNRCYVLFFLLLNLSVNLLIPGIGHAYPEQHRYFQISQNSLSEVGIAGVGQGTVAWIEYNSWNEGNVYLKFFDGTEVVDVHTYSPSEWDIVSRSRRTAVFGDCLIYKRFDSQINDRTWQIYDPKITDPELERPLVGGSLRVTADGDSVVWTRYIYGQDGQVQRAELVMYTCGTGMTTLATASGEISTFLLGSTIGFDYQFNDGVVVWTVPVNSPGTVWRDGDVTTEIWVHDSAGTRKVSECVYPEACSLFHSTNDVMEDFFRDMQKMFPQNTVDGGVVALRVIDDRTFKRECGSLKSEVAQPRPTIQTQANTVMS